MHPRLARFGEKLRLLLSALWSRAWPRRRGIGAIAAVLSLWAFATWETTRAVDFGFHWDEPRLVDSVAASARTGSALPGWYNYPSVSFDLGLLVLAPKVWPIVKEARNEAMRRPWEFGYDGVRKRVDVIRQALDTKLAPYAKSPAYLLRLRGMFAFLTMLTPIWTALAAWFWRRKAADAIVAGALVALSWEVAYHARWVAPDAIMMMFTALTLACVGAAENSPRPARWIYAGAVAASLAFGTKYPGGIVFVLVIGTSLRLGLRKGSALGWRAMLLQLAIATGLFVGLFALLSPGVWVDPLRTLADLTYEQWHYGEEGHGTHTVSSGWKHAVLILKWIGTAALSRYRPLALVLALLALPGLVLLARRQPARLVLWMIPPLFMFVYLAGQRTMIVRNLLMMVPFLAVLSGVFVGWGHDLLRDRRQLWIVVPLLASGALFFNAYWAQISARSILERRGRDVGALTRTWVSEHPRVKVRPSKRVCVDLGGACRPAFERAGKSGCRAMFWMSELEPRSGWPANQAHFDLLGMGPFEVNLDYYSTWAGDDRVVMLACDSLSGFYKDRFESIAATF